MLRKLRNAVQQKGQGIVEYALLLSFVVGIAMLLNGSNIGGAVKGVFDDVVTVFSDVKDYASALKHWGNMSKEELSKIKMKSDSRLIKKQWQILQVILLD